MLLCAVCIVVLCGCVRCVVRCYIYVCTHGVNWCVLQVCWVRVFGVRVSFYFVFFFFFFCFVRMRVFGVCVVRVCACACTVYVVCVGVCMFYDCVFSFSLRLCRV